MPAPLRPPLVWSDDNHAYRDKAHYHAYEQPNDQAGRPWRLKLSSMFTDEPGGPEEELGEYHVTSLADAKELAQALADQRGLAW